MKFTIRDFCILLIATMKLQNNTHFNSNHISKNIGEFYNDFDTKILFANLQMGKDKDIVGLKEYFYSLLFSGYGYFNAQGPEWEIMMNEDVATQIAERYSIIYQEAMNILVEKYQNSKKNSDLEKEKLPRVMIMNHKRN